MTTTSDHLETAALVLAKCAANDLWFPTGDQATVIAWAEVFAEAHLSRTDLLAGVTHAYRTEDEGFRPLPASIVRHAHQAYREQLSNLPQEHREHMENMTHALQDIGIDPPTAHRHARQITLGRTPELTLTPQQDQQLQALMNQQQQPTRRHIEPGTFARRLNDVLAQTLHQPPTHDAKEKVA